MIIENNIRRQRVLAGMTQEALAKKLGVRRETIVHLENGHYTPSLEVAMLLAKEFALPMEELFYFAEEPPRHSSAK